MKVYFCEIFQRNIYFLNFVKLKNKIGYLYSCMWNDLKTAAHCTVHSAKPSTLEHSEGLRELPKLAAGLSPGPQLPPVLYSVLHEG